MPIAGPLNGILVVDLSRVLAGPFCTMVLADLGARVVKVEATGTGDDARAFGPHLNGKSAYFMSVNRGKQSIALDLKAPGDRAIFERLLERADVLVENFRAGAMERLGYGYEVLHARYPRLIYAACSGFGHTGPLRERPAYDMVVQAMGGVMSLTGHPGGPPTRVGTSVGDLVAGLFTAIGVNSALYRRNETGEGMKVDVAMLDCQVAILENALARYFATGEVPGPLGARHPSITPFQCFSTADGHIIIAAGNDPLFRRLCEALGAPELAADPRFVGNAARNANVDALQAEIEARLATAPTAEWLARLEAAGLPCGPINNVEQIVNEPHTAARNMIVRTSDPVAGEVRMAGNPIKLSAYDDPQMRDPAPDLDEHRAAILRELGL
ncbi:MAG: CaiB/BaiF CoA transferase family protein [Alphaproteobacteria bacterium]